MNNYLNLESTKFKTNTFNLVIPLRMGEKISHYNLISRILKQGTAKYGSSKEISLYLDELYGALFDVFILKRGDYLFMNFFIKCINDKYTLNGEKLSLKCVEFIHDIIYNPLLEEECFKTDFFNQEKNNLIDLINSRTDDKNYYAVEKIEEVIGKGCEFSRYSYGDVNDLNKISNTELYDVYQNDIVNGEKFLFSIGDFDSTEIEKYFSTFLQGEHREYCNSLFKRDDFVYEAEYFNVAQGKFSLAFTLEDSLNQGDYYALLVMNTILGGGANSKLFRTVREENSLCYYVYSFMDTFKGILYITSGVDFKNYKKAKELCDEEISKMKSGEFDEDSIVLAKKQIINDLNSLLDSEYSYLNYIASRYIFNAESDLQLIKDNIKNVNHERILKVLNKMEPKAEFVILSKGDHKYE